jgi:hypothetical protein
MNSTFSSRWSRRTRSSLSDLRPGPGRGDPVPHGADGTLQEGPGAPARFARTGLRGAEWSASAVHTDDSATESRTWHPARKPGRDALTCRPYASPDRASRTQDHRRNPSRTSGCRSSTPTSSRAGGRARAAALAKVSSVRPRRAEPAAASTCHAPADLLRPDARHPQAIYRFVPRWSGSRARLADPTKSS